MRRLAALAALVALSAASCGGGSNETVTVFAASSLTDAFGDLAEEFERDRPGVEVRLVFGGSSSLALQLEEGAPADVFASADQRIMQRAGAAGVVGPDRTFATNEVVLAASTDAAVGGAASLTDTGAVLIRCGDDVPCGAATDRLLERLGVDPQFDSIEHNVRAVLTKIELGEADAGFVYRTDALGAGAAVEIVDVGVAPVEVDLHIAALVSAAHADLAAEFIALVISDKGRSILTLHGFG